jgi:hypothetical protein
MTGACSSYEANEGVLWTKVHCTTNRVATLPQLFSLFSVSASRPSTLGFTGAPGIIS